MQYYNNDVVRLKRAIIFIFNDLIKYQDILFYEQEKIDINALFSETREYPSLYKQSEEEVIKELKSSIIELIQSNKGRNLVLYDFDGKKYSLGLLNRIQGKTTHLLESIYDELKIRDPQIKPLPVLPSSAVDLEE